MNNEISKKISELEIIKKQKKFLSKLKEKSLTKNNSTPEKEVDTNEQDK